MSAARTPSPTKAPPLAIAVDIVAVTVLFLGAVAVYTGHATVRLGIIRLSAGSMWRPMAAALAALVVRNLLVPRPLSFLWVFDGAGAPLALGERQLFDDDEGWRRVLVRTGWVAAAFAALVAALTWPQIREMYAVHDFGDPLFSVWRLAWVNHQLVRDPVHLFDANIFYPERLTLTYSDAMLVPALVAMPLFRLGVPPLVIHNILLLSGFVFSGVTMFLLVRALTGRIDAALVSGAIFAVYPYRLEHYSHLELQMTMWMPLALWGLHRTLARGRIRDGLATGLAFALQSLSSLYYGCFLAVFMVVVGLAVWLAHHRPWRPLVALSAGAALAALLIAPVAAAYLASKPMMGERERGTVEFYSAQGDDYLMPTQNSLVYGRWAHGGTPERALFPRVTPVVLSIVALWPPLSAARIAYVLGLAVAVDGSLGLHGPTFTWLDAHLAPFRSLRVPARFSVLAGMALAVLAGFGAARILNRFPQAARLLAATMVAAVAFEALPSLELREPWHTPPPIYNALSRSAPAVLAEFPMPTDILDSAFDARYLYFSIFHWQKLVNGNSGFFPPSYKELLAREADFPSDDALDYLRRRGVQYLTYHGGLTNPTRAHNTFAKLDSRPDLELVAKAPWNGGESRLYRFRP